MAGFIIGLAFGIAWNLRMNERMDEELLAREEVIDIQGYLIENYLRIISEQSEAIKNQTDACEMMKHRLKKINRELKKTA